MRRGRQAYYLFVALIAVTSAYVLQRHWVSRAQTTCKTPVSQGWQWPQNTTVYYDVSALSSTEQSAVVKALSLWNPQTRRATILS